MWKYNKVVLVYFSITMLSILVIVVNTYHYFWKCSTEYRGRNLDLFENHHSCKEVCGHLWNSSLFEQSYIKIAIIVSITTREYPSTLQKDINPAIPDTMAFFKDLVPSFCETASVGYLYTFFMVYDYDDNYFATNMTYRSAFTAIFRKKVQACKHISVDITYAQSFTSQRIAQSQNLGSMMAYTAGYDYLYRINDDVILKTSGWTEIFVKALKDMKPSNVGVVGPKHDKGNMLIMQFEFVHRTHIGIFGFHYPSYFSNWGAPAWIQGVYLPNNFSWLKTVAVAHNFNSKGSSHRYVLTNGDTGEQHQLIVHNLIKRSKKQTYIVLRKCCELF